MTDINKDGALDWDDVIEKDGGDFVILPEGDYDFRVVGFERAMHDGSAKLPPCPKAVLKIEVEGPEGTVPLTHNLFLHKKTEGLICAFFTSIGHRKHGEQLKMNWPATVGSTGRLKLAVRSYKGNDGNDYQSNEIKKFYEKEEPATVGGFIPAGAYKPGEF